MRKFGFLAAAAAAAVLAGCGLGAPAYPEFGEASYRLEGTTISADNGASTHTVIYRDGPKMRVEATLPTYGQATVVFDESTNAAYVLNPTGPVASVPAPASGGATPPAQPSMTPSVAPNATAPTPPAATAAAPPQVTGVAVRIEDADAPQPLETAWAALGAENARHVGRCEVAGEQGHEWRPRDSSAGVERVACITDDGIVLRVREDSRVLWEATGLQRGEQDAALFGVPPGYQLIDPDAVAEQVGESMEQLDSVTGAPERPREAPAPRG